MSAPASVRAARYARADLAIPLDLVVGLSHEGIDASALENCVALDLSYRDDMTDFPKHHDSGQPIAGVGMRIESYFPYCDDLDFCLPQGM